MDPTESSTELTRVRAEVERLRLDLNRVESFRRQLEAARDQLRRAEEAIERRDTIVREARKQITTLSRNLDEARRETRAQRQALSEARGSRWYAMRDAVRWAKRRPWRWLVVPWKVLRRREAEPVPEGPEPTPTWEPPAAVSARPRVPRSPASLRVAALVGSGLHAQLEPECTLVTFGPESWQGVLEDSPPHVLLVESDAYANDGGWQGQLEEGAEPNELRAVIAWSRARQIPTVFWNTADPIELERWLPIAALFDNVLTVDGDAVARYGARGALGMANIAAVAGGVQPRTFGPGSSGRANRACFVVTEAHTEDARLWGETQEMLGAVKEAGVDLYAQPGITVPPSLSAEVRELTEPLSSLYRRYAVVLSSPARGDSKAKIPRRVLEMLASGAAVVAVASPDVSLHLGSVVTTFRDNADTAEGVRRLLDDEAGRARIALEGLTFVLRAHTMMHRLAAIASAAGLAIDAEAERRVAALVLADDVDDAEQAVGSLAGQSHSPDEIILGTKSRASDLEGIMNSVTGARVRIVKQDGDGRAQRLRELARTSSTPWVFVTAARGDAALLESLILRAPFVGADAVAHATAPGAADSLTADITPTPVVVRTSLVAERGWPEDTETIHRWSREGVHIYAVEPPR